MQIWQPWSKRTNFKTNQFQNNFNSVTKPSNLLTCTYSPCSLSCQRHGRQEPVPLWVARACRQLWRRDTNAAASPEEPSPWIPWLLWWGHFYLRSTPEWWPSWARRPSSVRPETQGGGYVVSPRQALHISHHHSHFTRVVSQTLC